MGRSRPRHLVDFEYEDAAQAYLRSLPPEHFMETTPQATQRIIFVESLELVRADRPEVQFYNELLVQYPFGQPPVIRQVVPDNMVVLYKEPLKVLTSFNLPLQPVGPFWVLEYVSKHSKRKDYEDSHHKYEQELKVPYYLTFYPDNQEMTLSRHTRRCYRTVTPEANGRYPIPELEMELALLDGWVRFWYQAQLLPLPAELQQNLKETRRLLATERQLLAEERQRVEREREARLALAAEVARLRAQLGLPPASPS
jgi:Uma2 family endonuclease